MKPRHVLLEDIVAIMNRLNPESGTKVEEIDVGFRQNIYDVLDRARAMVKTEDAVHYEILPPENGWRRRDSFSDAERAKLRPIAEVCAMLDGNSFFGMTKDGNGDDSHFQSYLPEADAIYESNGGDDGWAGEASFAKYLKIEKVRE